MSINSHSAYVPSRESSLVSGVIVPNETVRRDGKYRESKLRHGKDCNTTHSVTYRLISFFLTLWKSLILSKRQTERFIKSGFNLKESGDVDLSIEDESAQSISSTVLKTVNTAVLDSNGGREEQAELNHIHLKNNEKCCSVHKDLTKTSNSPQRNGLVKPLIPESFEVKVYKPTASHYTRHNGHCKTKSCSCEVATENELTSKYSRPKRQRCFSEGHAESEPHLKPSNQYPIKVSSEHYLVNCKSDEDVDSSLKIPNDCELMNAISKHPGSTSKQERRNVISTAPSLTLTNTRQEHNTHEIVTLHDIVGIEDQAKSTTDDLDRDKFKSGKEKCESLPIVDKLKEEHKIHEEQKQCECCGMCSGRYAELQNRVDAIIHDYQWAVKRLEAMQSVTGELNVFKGRAIKVGGVTIVVILFLVFGTAAISAVRETLYGNDVSKQEFNITTWIAKLHEQYVSVSDMVNDLMIRSKSVIHLTNGGMVAKQGGSYAVRWVANENHGQGSLVLSENGDSIVAPTGGYYRICAKMFYKATMENVTSIKLEYDLVRSSGGYHEHVRHAVREFPAASGSLQYELQLDTILYVYPQDAILLSVRPDQIRYLANFDSAHEFSMLEVG